MPDPVLVVGYDGSPSSRAALRYAGQRAAREGSRLVVACVHPLPPADLNERAYAALLADHRAKARACLDGLDTAPPEELDGVEWTALAEGARSPARGLLDIAARDDALEIVVGSTGRGRVGALLGSVAHALLREADRPVVVIPARAVEAIGEPAP